MESKKETEYFEEKKARSGKIGWPQIIRNLVIDTYKSHNAEIWQGFQKDGIQNAIDAINKKSKDNPEVWIRYLSKDELSLLIIEDRGTYGLTGVIPDEKQNYDNLNDNDRWARFENIAFGKEKRKGETTLGARGQGKLMLMATSSKLKIEGNQTWVDDNDKPTMYYDTLLEDGSYRIGKRQIESYDMTLNYEEGERAKGALKNITKNLLEPLEKIGTRIIILNPRKDVVDSLKNGNMENTISIDWHPILSSLDTQKRKLGRVNSRYINIDINGDSHSVKPNSKLMNLEDKKEKGLEFWIKKNRTMNFKKVPYKIDLVAACLPEDSELEYELSGIGIYRGGMKITSISNRRLPDDLMKRIYGYVTVGAKLEDELRNVEDPTHYTFENIDRGVGPAGALKSWINAELLLFAREKLGYSDKLQEDKNLKKKKSISDALNVINNLAKKFNLSSLGTSRPDIPPSPPKHKPLRLEIKKIKFPGTTGNRRVNYGETIEDIGCDIANDSEEPVFGKMSITAQIGKIRLIDIFEEDIEIKPGEVMGTNFCDLLVKKDDFQDEGRYHIKYTFTLGTAIDSLDMEEGRMISRKQEFWVEADPSIKGIFKEIRPASYTDDFQKPLTGQAIPAEKGGWIFEYNISHPRYDNVNEDRFTDYLAEIVLPWLMYIDITENDIEDRHIVHYEVDNEEEFIVEILRSMGHLEYTFFGE